MCFPCIFYPSLLHAYYPLLFFSTVYFYLIFTQFMTHKLFLFVTSLCHVLHLFIFYSTFTSMLFVLFFFYFPTCNSTTLLCILFSWVPRIPSRVSDLLGLKGLKITLTVKMAMCLFISVLPSLFNIYWLNCLQLRHVFDKHSHAYIYI